MTLPVNNAAVTRELRLFLDVLESPQMAMSLVAVPVVVLNDTTGEFVGHQVSHPASAASQTYTLIPSDSKKSRILRLPGWQNTGSTTVAGLEILFMVNEADNTGANLLNRERPAAGAAFDAAGLNNPSWFLPPNWRLDWFVQANLATDSEFIGLQSQDIPVGFNPTS